MHICATSLRVVKRSTRHWLPLQGQFSACVPCVSCILLAGSQGGRLCVLSVDQLLALAAI